MSRPLRPVALRRLAAGWVLILVLTGVAPAPTADGTDSGISPAHPFTGATGAGDSDGSDSSPVVDGAGVAEEAGSRLDTVQWLDTSDRDAVVTATDAAFAAETPALQWTGDHDGCRAGTSSSEHRRATLARVNYYRAMAGVSARVIEDFTLSDRAQEAAVMMSAQGELSHDPPTTFACYTEVAHQAAANSNLYLGRTGPSAVDGYIEDPGIKNVDVGHRTTLLHPPTRRMGVGDVAGSELGASANVLWVFDERVFDESGGPDAPTVPTPMREPDRFVAWPPRGYVPGQLIHPRWSFTRTGIDLSRAEVRVFRPSAPPGQREVPLTVVDRSGAPGHVPLPTLVWELEIDRGPAVDTDYLVVISGVAPGPDPVATPVATATAGHDGATTDGAGRVAGSPTAYAYTVRVLGRTPGAELTPSEALARIGDTTD